MATTASKQDEGNSGSLSSPPTLHDEVHQLHAIIDLDGNSFRAGLFAGLDGLAQRGRSRGAAFASHGDQLPVGEGRRPVPDTFPVRTE